MKNSLKIISITFTLFLGSPCFLIFQNLSASTELYSMRSIPKNGLNVDWPILNDRQYFTYKGKSSRILTLRSVMQFDCHQLTTLYGQDPQMALDTLEMFILSQLALRGIDIQTMDSPNRENLALSEITKRLRQFGRIEETKNLFKTPRVVPTIAGLCDVLQEDKKDLLRQKYHIKHQWDRYKVAQVDAAD